MNRNQNVTSYHVLSTSYPFSAERVSKVQKLVWVQETDEPRGERNAVKSKTSAFHQR